jgi:hypothetical protein
MVTIQRILLTVVICVVLSVGLGWSRDESVASSHIERQRALLQEQKNSLDVELLRQITELRIISYRLKNWQGDNNADEYHEMVSSLATGKIEVTAITRKLLMVDLALFRVDCRLKGIDESLIQVLDSPDIKIR